MYTVHITGWEKLTATQSLLSCLLMKCSEHTLHIQTVDLFESKEHTITG